MTRQKYPTTWETAQQEMSIAGSPAKIAQLGRDIIQLIGKTMDETNHAEIINTEFMLEICIREIRRAKKRYEKSHTLK